MLTHVALLKQLVRGFIEHSSISSSQSEPVKPSGHSQRKLVFRLTQFPRIHGDGRQRLKTVSQRRPEYPGGPF